MQLSRPSRLRVTALIGAFGIVLASCAIGETRPAQNVTDVSARLTGLVHNTITGPTDYWFEYGPSTTYGSSTVHRSVNVTDTTKGVPVGEAVLGLAEGTTYHDRLCARDADGKGVCGADTTLTTTSGHDAVSGTGIVVSLPPIAYYGATVDAVSDPIGANATGRVESGPGSFYVKIADAGPVTCLRVDGNRATIGYIAVPPDLGIPDVEPIPKLVFIEDNGATGDRYSTRAVSAPATTCPAATAADFPNFLIGGFSVPPVITSGDFVVHDHPAT